MIEIAVKQIPDLCEAFASIRGIGSGMIARGNITEKETKLFQEKILIMHDQIKRFKRTKSIIQETTLGANFLLNMDSESKLDQILSSFLQPCESLAGYQPIG